MGREVLQDWPVAERLALMHPTEFPSVRALREHILQVIDDRLREGEPPAPAPPGREFHFSQSISVIYPAGYVARTLDELCEGIRRASGRTLFFHLIEARLRIGRRTTDLSSWLSDDGGLPQLALPDHQQSAPLVSLGPRVTTSRRANHPPGVIHAQRAGVAYARTS